MLDIRIAKPCDQTWTAMRGDDQVRHCGACRKNVYNIAAMTEAEVEALIRRTEGHFCARVYRRTDGRVLTADCPRGVAAVRRRRTLAVTAAMTAVVGVLWPVLSATQGKPAQPRHRRSYEDGSMVELAGSSDDPITGIVAHPVMGAPMVMGKIAVIPKR